MREIPPYIQARIRRMAKRIAYRNFWMGDKVEVVLDLEQEGYVGFLASKRTDEYIVNRDIRRAMIDYILRWSYGVVHRQSTSLKTFTISTEDQPRTVETIDPAPSAESCVYVNEVADNATERLKSKCRVVDISVYKAMIKAMIENDDPYLTKDASKKVKKLKGLSRSTQAFMKRNIQQAFREAA